MLKAQSITDYNNVHFIQSTDQPYILNIVQLDTWNFEQLIGRFNFFTKEGYLLLLNGTRKEYSRFQSLMNNFFKFNEMFGWNSKVVESAQLAGKEAIKAEKVAAEKDYKELYTNKAYDYLTKLSNKDPLVIKSLQAFKDLTDDKLIEVINNSFKNSISKQIITDIFNAIKEVLTPVTIETSEDNDTPKFYTVMVTYNGIESQKGIWANNIEDATNKAYFKWTEADKREVIDPNNKEVSSTPVEPVEVVTTQEESNYTNYTNTNETTYTVGNRSFTTYSEACDYCTTSDFDPELMIQEIKEPEATQVPSTQPVEIFHYYNQTFPSYMDAYDHAIRNYSPVTMVLSSLHPTMSNERLMELEKEYTFSKHNMAITDMLEYFEYISTLPDTLDKEDRYYKLKGWIQRYENKQQSIKEREEYLQSLSIKADEMLKYMCENGLEIVSNECFVKYLLDGEQVHIWFSGISIEEYYKGIENVYNSYFNNESKAV